jgi:hypothetical protein
MHTNLLHVVQPFTCQWGQQFCVGDIVVDGHYYQSWGKLDSSYVLLSRSHVVYIHVCHVRAIKFPMLPSNHKVHGNELIYKLSVHAEYGIKHVIASIEL